MNKILRILFFTILLFQVKAQTQQPKLFQIKTFIVKAEVISVLQGRNDMAVLQIKEASKNNTFSLKENDEILTTFHFSVKPTTGDEKFPGIKAGDVIEGDMYGKLNRNNVQVDYTMFRYSILQSGEKKKTTE